MGYGTSTISGRVAGGVPSFPGRTWYVNNNSNLSPYASGWDSALSTIQSAADQADEGDGILIAPGEYDEDVTIETGRLTIAGVGPRHSVRITGLSAGTKTAMTINGVNEVCLYNLNLEGRTASGSGLELTGQIRRLNVEMSKIHGGDQAMLLDVAAGGQIVDVRFDDVVFANSAIGVNVDYGGGDPCHQLVFRDCYWSKITTDCVVQNGATHDYCFIRPIFGLSDGNEATRILDIDDAGTTGQIIDPRFCTTLFATGKIAIASGVMIVGWRTEREVEATDGGTNGRPD